MTNLIIHCPQGVIIFCGKVTNAINENLPVISGAKVCLIVVSKLHHLMKFPQDRTLRNHLMFRLIE